MPEFWDIYLKKDRKRLQVWEIASNLPPNWSFWWKTNARKHVFLTRNFIFFALCLSVFPNKTCPGNSNIFRRQKLVRGIPTLSGEFLSGEFQPPCKKWGLSVALCVFFYMCEVLPAADCWLRKIETCCWAASNWAAARGLTIGWLAEERVKAMIHRLWSFRANLRAWSSFETP